MRRTVVVAAALVLLITGRAAAYEVASYDLRLETRVDGSGRAVATVAVRGAVPSPLAIPVGIANVSSATWLQGPAVAAIRVEQDNRQSVVLITFAGPPPAEFTCSFAAEVKDAFLKIEPAAGEKSTLPRGARVLRHALVNTQPAVIARYTAELLFAPGLRAHAIREALPKPGKKEAEPRVRLVSSDSHDAARLSVKNLRQGDAASAQIELVPRRRSFAWLIAGLLLSVAYLIHFRDLVSRDASNAEEK